MLRALVLASILSAIFPRYDRSQWRHWVDADGDCQDTRQEVLIRDSQVPVEFADARHCRVASGRWLDPYTGLVLTAPGEVDVDHVVPLENAHRSGGWAWTPRRREEFANDLRPGHLRAVSARANRSKGSKGPEEWRPPLRSDWCAYARDWRMVKRRYRLLQTPPEERALRLMSATCRAEKS